MDKKRLSKGLRKYIRRQKMLIAKMTKTEEEKRSLVRELLGRFYKKISKET